MDGQQTGKKAQLKKKKIIKYKRGSDCLLLRGQFYHPPLPIV